MNTNDIYLLETLTPKQKRVAAALITTDGDLAAAAHIIGCSINTMYQYAKTLADKLLVTQDTQAVISFMNVTQFVNYVVTRSKSVELPCGRLITEVTVSRCIVHNRTLENCKIVVVPYDFPLIGVRDTDGKIVYDFRNVSNIKVAIQENGSERISFEHLNTITLCQEFTLLTIVY